MRHGMYGHELYRTWTQMKSRCNDPNATSYPRYGAKGIKVCKRWSDSFPAFVKDMGPRPPGTTLDRIDSTKDYAPGNCRWATKAEQDANRTLPRGERVNTSRLTAAKVTEIRDRYARGGVSQAALAVEFGVDQTSISDVVLRLSWRHV